MFEAFGTKFTLQFPLAYHAYRTCRCARIFWAGSHTKLDHFFLHQSLPAAPLQLDGHELAPEIICGLGWWIRNAKIEVSRVSRHLLIQTTYPGQREPNLEISIREENGQRYLALESIYLDDFGGYGLGSCALLRCALAARRIGCSFIAVQASGKRTRSQRPDSGHYSWPRMGFNGPLSLEVKEQLRGKIGGEIMADTVRDAVLLYKEQWKDMPIITPLTFKLEDQTSDLPYLLQYLSSRSLLLDQ